MQIWRVILPAATAALMLAIIPAEQVYLRFSWQLASLWLAALVFCAWLTNGWRRLFFLLALLAVVRHGPVLTAYIQLLMIAVFLAAAEGFKRMPPAHIFNALAAGAGLLCAWIFAQRLGWVSTFDLGRAGAGPFNINAAAVYLALCLPALFRNRWWRFSVFQINARWLLPVVIAGLVLCRSTTGFCAALASAGVYAITGSIDRRLIPAAAGAAALVVVFFIWFDPIAAVFTDVRWQAWALIARTSWQVPWGQGLGSFYDIFGRIAADPDLGGVWRQAHNEYLQAAWEMGLAAGALLAVYPLRVLIAAWRRRKSITATQRLAAAGIAAVAVSCLGWHTMHIAPLALAAMAWIGLAENCDLADLWLTRGLRCRIWGAINAARPGMLTEN